MSPTERLREAHRSALAEYVETDERRLDWSSIELPGLRADGEEIPRGIMFGEYDEHTTTLFTGIIRRRNEATS